MFNEQEFEILKKDALENHIPIIMDDTLEVIEKTLSENKPKRILEIGAAIGYSAICFTEYLAEGGIIETIERDTERDYYMSADEAAAYGLIDTVISNH